MKALTKFNTNKTRNAKGKWTMTITRQSMEKEILYSTSLIREMKIKRIMNTIFTYSMGKF